MAAPQVCVYGFRSSEVTTGAGVEHNFLLASPLYREIHHLRQNLKTCLNLDNRKQNIFKG